jgi:hypothetical protein
MMHVQEFEVFITLADDEGRWYQISTIEDFEIEPLDTTAPELSRPREIVRVEIHQGYRTLKADCGNGVLINLEP